MEKKPLYAIQIEHDWYIGLEKDISDLDGAQDSVHLLGNFNKTLDMSLPHNMKHVISQFWLNIMRIDNVDTFEMISTTVNIPHNEISSRPIALLHTPQHLKCDVLDVEFDPLSRSLHVMKKIPQTQNEQDSTSFSSTERTIIDTLIHRPLYTGHIAPQNKKNKKSSQSEFDNVSDLNGLDNDIDDILLDPSLDFSDLGGLDPSSDATKTSKIVKQQADKAITESFAGYDGIMELKRPDEQPIMYCLDVNSQGRILVGGENGTICLLDHDNTKNKTSDNSTKYDKSDSALVPSHPLPLWESISYTKTYFNNDDSNTSGHVGDVNRIRWLDNDILFLSCGSDTTVKLWAPEYNRVVKTFTGHTRGVIDIQPIASNALFASLSRYGILHLFSPKDDRPVQTYDLTNAFASEIALHSSSLISSIAHNNENETIYISLAREMNNMSPYMLYPTSQYGMIQIDLRVPNTSSDQYNNILLSSHIKQYLLDNPCTSKYLSGNDYHISNVTFHNDSDNSTFIVGYESGLIQLYDLRNVSEPVSTQQVFDSSVTGLTFNSSSSSSSSNNQQYIASSYQGEVYGLSHDLSQVSHVYSGTQQPLQGLCARNIEHNGTSLSSLYACGDDGILQWSL